MSNQRKVSSPSPKKKRKATSSSSADAGKRSVTVEIENSSPLDNPIVVSFPSGVPESVQADGTTGTKMPDFEWGKLNKKSTAGRRVFGKDKHCVYTASAAGLGFDDRRTKLCVGVYNKKTGTVTIREAACRGTVFSLQQSIPSYIEKNGHVQFTAGQNLLSYNNSVFEDFGSAKKRKALKSQAANRVELSSVVGAGEDSAVMQQVIMGQAMSESNRKAIEGSKEPSEGNVNGLGNKAIDDAHEAARKRFLPKYDEMAVKPNKVYSARDIAGEAAWKKVYNRIFAAMHDDDPTESIIGMMFENAWQPSVLKLVKTINTDAPDCKDRYSCAVLANEIIRFYSGNHRRKSMPPVNTTKKTYFGISVEIALRCIDLFTTSMPETDGSMAHVMSKQNKDKCIVHILLLYMMACGKSMKIPDLKPLASDLKIPVNDCAQILRLAGCHVVKKGATLSAVLKTPLEFPRPKRSIARS